MSRRPPTLTIDEPGLTCDVCRDEETGHSVHLGPYDPPESYPVRVCVDCLRHALRLMEERQAADVATGEVPKP